ncbi:hypothetical protein BLNAU_15795 [Blattamonas nauphoetae]|uniref:Uncharacterized protein n=1 Tax=Blattamonas nauphoetae TaxID=2049346 RepID=A0ABQ9X9U3_9EUKA|nr:hypothetical protein BLNAU_15795 [Blattamonas nauphoetae]
MFIFLIIERAFAQNLCCIPCQCKCDTFFPLSGDLYSPYHDFDDSDEENDEEDEEEYFIQETQQRQSPFLQNIFGQSFPAMDIGFPAQSNPFQSSQMLLSSPFGYCTPNLCQQQFQQQPLTTQRQNEQKIRKKNENEIQSSSKPKKKKKSTEPVQSKKVQKPTTPNGYEWNTPDHDYIGPAPRCGATRGGLREKLPHEPQKQRDEFRGQLKKMR